jgi:hypothetical protein
MTPDQLAVGWVGQLAVVAVLAGLARRGRWRLAWLFTAYLLFSVVCGTLIATWPERFYTARFWVVKEGLYEVMRLGLALEIALRAFRRFPGARPAWAMAASAVLTLMLMALADAGWSVGADPAYLAAGNEALPRLAVGTLWLVASVFALAHWYHVPLHPFHAAVLAGLGVYLALFGGLLRLESVYGGDAQAYLNALNPPAAMALTFFWAWAAWRPPGDAEAAHTRLLRRLELHAPCG